MKMPIAPSRWLLRRRCPRPRPPPAAAVSRELLRVLCARIFVVRQRAGALNRVEWWRAQRGAARNLSPAAIRAAATMLLVGFKISSRLAGAMSKCAHQRATLAIPPTAFTESGNFALGAGLALSAGFSTIFHE
jgi:hypothetical protein